MLLVQLHGSNSVFILRGNGAVEANSLGSSLYRPLDTFNLVFVAGAKVYRKLQFGLTCLVNVLSEILLK